MSSASLHTSEEQAESAFSRQSVIFDALYSGNTIINYKRERVRSHALQLLPPGASILELNSGTGEDALFFAQQGYQVHATDVSAGMQDVIRQKIAFNNPGGSVTTELCSYTMLHQLKNRGPFDHIFSNFAGLNCTGELDKVLASFPGLLKPGGTITLVILPKFCLWETMLLFKGKFRTACRRFFSQKGVKAHIEGVYFKCWYYNPSFITGRLKDEFELLGIEGLCALVPPSYIDGFAEKHPVIYKSLVNMENKLKSAWPWKYIGDYYIISFKKK